MEPPLRRRLDVGHENVVQYSTLFVTKQAITHAANRQVHDFPGQDMVQKLLTTITVKAKASHVGDVEECRGISASLMLRYDRLVLDWHLITSKRDHLAAMSTVPCVERCFGELGRHWFFTVFGTDITWAVNPKSIEGGAMEKTACRDHGEV